MANRSFDGGLHPMGTVRNEPQQPRILLTHLRARRTLPFMVPGHDITQRLHLVILYERWGRLDLAREYRELLVREAPAGGNPANENRTEEDPIG